MKRPEDPSLHTLQVRLPPALYAHMKAYNRRQMISLGKRYYLNTLIAEAVIEKLKREGFLPENIGSAENLDV